MSHPDADADSLPTSRPAQRDYYRLAGAAAGLAGRLQALRHHILSGSVLDVGCNDGTIAGTLLREGLVTKAQGVDLEVLHDQFPVLSGDLLTLPLNSLGSFDNVLYLNVHHHLIASTFGTERQRLPAQILLDLLGNCRRLFFEMGSTTEQGEWGWLKILRSEFGTDEAAFSALFGDRMYFEIHRYPMQGGHRRMLLVMGNAPDHWPVSDVQWYARNVAAYPLSKRLAKVSTPEEFPPGPVGHASNDWMPHVKFVTFQHAGKSFFGKRHDRQKYDLPLTLKIYEALRRTRFASQVVSPLYFSTRFGIVWEFDPELMVAPFGNALVVHLHDVAHAEFGLHERAYQDEISALANHALTIDGVTKPVRRWCDFQSVKTTRGLRFIDFDAF